MPSERDIDLAKWLDIEQERQFGVWVNSEAARLIETYRKEVTAPLVEALEKLRDCNWVITPADRMDAVRSIAREALEQYRKESE